MGANPRRNIASGPLHHNRPAHCRTVLRFAVLCCALQVLTAQAGSDSDLSAMSLDSLLDIPVVTAAKYSQQASDAPASVSVITAEDIRRYGWTTLDEAMEAVRGLYITNDHQYENLGVRGFSRPGDYNSKITFMVNGHTIQEAVYHQSAMGTIFGVNFDEIERIEIVRGPGSALYGTGAMLAIVNVILKNPESRRGLGLQVDGGLHNTRAGSLSGATRFGKQGVLSLSARAANSDGSSLYLPAYDNEEWGDGQVSGVNWLDSYSYVSQLRYRKVKVLAYTLSRLKGNGAAAWGTSYAANNAYLRDTYYGIELAGERRLSRQWTLFAEGAFDGYDYAADFPYDDPDPDSREYARDEKLSSELRADWTPSSAQRILIGVESNVHLKVQAENMYEDGSEGVTINNPFHELSAFAQSEYTIIPPVTVTAGGRYSQYSTALKSFVPRGAMLWKPIERTSIRLLYGEAFRIPSVYETSWKEPESWAANDDVEPERIRASELILEQRLGERWKATASAFHYDVLDLIDAYSETDEDLPSYRNLGAAQADGIETEIACRVPRGFQGQISYGYQFVRDKADGSVLTNSPLHLLKAGGSQRVSRLLYAGLEYRFEAARKTVAGSYTSAVHLVNLALTTSERLDPWRISLRVKNAFNTSWSVPGGEEFMLPSNNVDMPEVPQNSRMITLSLAYRVRI